MEVKKLIFWGIEKFSEHCLIKVLDFMRFLETTALEQKTEYKRRSALVIATSEGDALIPCQITSLSTHMNQTT